MESWAGLHDAILLSVLLEWQSGTLVAETDGHMGRISLQANELRSFRCSRLMPWGPSEFINTATRTESEQGQVLLIEMQSGDEIEIACTRVTFDLVG